MPRQPVGDLHVVVLDHTGALGGAEVALVRLLDAIGRGAGRDGTRDGIDTEVLLFADGPLLARLEDAGHPAHLLPLSDDIGGRGREDLVRGPLALAQGGAQTLRFAVRLARWLRERAPDLVVANSLKSAVILAAAAPLARVPWVWHLHDRLSPDYLSSALVRGLRVMARVGPRRIVANSTESAALLGPLPPGRVAVAYPGLPADGFVPREDEPDRPRFGLLGRIGATKGQKEFLHAAAQVAADRPDVTFAIIGAPMFNDDGYAAEVHDLPAALAIADRVQFVGWTEDPRAELTGLTALVHASPVPEPFGQVIVEAMGAGVPVIATRGGGVTEILSPEGAPADGPDVRTSLGQLVAPGDPDALASAMRWVLEHPSETERLAQAALASARDRFAIARTAEVVSGVWRQARRR